MVSSLEGVTIAKGFEGEMCHIIIFTFSFRKDIPKIGESQRGP